MSLEDLRRLETLADLKWKCKLTVPRSTLLPLLELDYRAFRFADREVLNDYQLAQQLIKRWPCLLSYYPTSIKDKELVLLAIEHSPLGSSYLRDIPYELLSQTEVHRLAIAKDGLVIAKLEKELVTKELALLAVRQNGKAYVWLPQELKTDPDIIEAALRQNNLVIEDLACHGLLTSKWLLLIAPTYDISPYLNLGHYLKEPDFVVALLSLKPELFKDRRLPDSILENWRVALAFIKYDFDYIRKFRLTPQLEAHLIVDKILPVYHPSDEVGRLVEQLRAERQELHLQNLNRHFSLKKGQWLLDQPSLADLTIRYQ